ncbi:hypothetical protein GCM10010468_52470 [Actinocorallia longicatena]|uniref:Uncharacterized protein n=1 Tax=Actinocorallia longicatena TaxID=111803 RepID=A0ABP6QFV0_9ACTN
MAPGLESDHHMGIAATGEDPHPLAQILADKVEDRARDHLGRLDVLGFLAPPMVPPHCRFTIHDD